MMKLFGVFVGFSLLMAAHAHAAENVSLSLNSNGGHNKDKANFANTTEKVSAWACSPF
ncbi:hypothetical protein IAD21_01113 [Abditibacteriota bacterium]|nr:hypothetical protein IAD21_01113 [Abditibacteriota bacterium]